MRRLTAIVVTLLVLGLPTFGLTIAAPTDRPPVPTSTGTLPPGTTPTNTPVPNPTGTPTPVPITPTSTSVTTGFPGYCLVGPANTLTPCPVTPTPTRTPITPNKTLSISGAAPGPAGTTSYNVSVTSQFACFALNEPVSLYTLGNPNAAALTPLYPTFVPSQGHAATIQVQTNPNLPNAGTAQLLLEVFPAVVGPEGLDLKAVWSQEGIEQVINVVPPAATATPLPGSPTPTATAAPTAPPTATATSTPNTQPLTVRACTDPQVVSGSTLGGGSYTLYGQTTPGAVCYPSATDSTVVNANDLTGQTALSDGLVVFPLTENSPSDYGTATVTCSLNGQTATGSTYFFILQKGQVQATQAAGCVPTSNSDVEASVTVSNLTPPQGSSVSIGGCFFANGAGVAGVTMHIVAHLTTGPVSCSAVTDTSGRATCSVDVDTSDANTPVGVGAYFSYSGTQYFVPAAFTPQR